MKRNNVIILMIVLFFASMFSISFRNDKDRTSYDFEFSKHRKPIELIEKRIVEDRYNNQRKIMVTIAATGDIMFHTPQINGGYDEKTGNYDFSYSFEAIKPYIESADIAIGNFETVTAGPEHGFTGYPRFNTPKVAVKNLKEVGYDILATANNHSLDRGKEGVIETIENIKSHGLKNIGTYTQKDYEILLEDVKGIKIAFLNYTYGCNGLESLLTPEELNYMVNRIDKDKIKNDIEKAKRLKADIITVFIHWGNEYYRQPSVDQMDLASSMVSWGADIILGSHPHVIQKSEFLQHEGERKFVIYSMGNFISNQRYETIQNKYTEDGVIVQIDIEKDIIGNVTKIKAVDFIPTWVNRNRVSGKYKHQIIPTEEYLYGEDNTLSVEVISRIHESYNNTMQLVSPE